MSQLPKAKKALGQHFLQDQKVIKDITSDWHEECDVIIEIGPGPGVLTKLLSEKNKPFYVIEKDRSFNSYLEPLVGPGKLYFADALKFDWETFLQENDLQDKKIWLVSNLPYNVGTVLFVQFMQIQQFEYLTLMFQKEVGDKTFQEDKKPQMSGLFFLSQNFFTSKRLLKVLPGAFSPPPKVDSVVVSYQRKPIPDIPISDFNRLNKFTRNIFGMKRKQLGKVLKSFSPVDSIEELLNTCNIERTRRAETLTYQEVLLLFNNSQRQS
jgi:16S rRNA (adenine1518-N6/adenine1519-N6)-dimethyltransferase